MSERSFLRVSLATVILTFVGFAAFGQNNRSAVSVSGMDSNPCTIALPCRSFGAAVTVTNPGGEIIALTSAGYGPFTIDRSLTVSGAPGVHAAISLTTSGTAVIVSATSADRIIVRNLVLIGAGPAAFGIYNVTSAELHVQGCLIRSFFNAGIFSQSGSLSIDDTALIDNPGAGVSIDSSRGTISNSLLQGNGTGLVTTASATSASVVLVNSVISGSSTNGIDVRSTFGTGALVANVTVEDCTIAHNATGIMTTASGGNNDARIAISQNVIAYNTTGAQTSGGAISSFGNNRFVGNGVDGGPFASIAFQ